MTEICKTCRKEFNFGIWMSPQFENEKVLLFCSEKCKNEYIDMKLTRIKVNYPDYYKKIKDEKMEFYSKTQPSGKLKNAKLTKNLTKEELEALYQIVREYQENKPDERYEDYDDFEEQIDKRLIISILKKINKELPKEIKEEIDKDFLRKKYHHYNNDIDEKAYRVLEKAFDQLKTVEISYFNMDSAEFKKRNLDIYYKSRKYTIGYCHLRKSIRKF